MGLVLVLKMFPISLNFQFFSLSLFFNLFQPPSEMAAAGGKVDAENHPAKELQDMTIMVPENRPRAVMIQLPQPPPVIIHVMQHCTYLFFECNCQTLSILMIWTTFSQIMGRIFR